MLESPIEDVLVNACNAIDLLCRKNEFMQTELAKYNIIEQLTELLALDSSKWMVDDASNKDLVVLLRNRNPPRYRCLGLSVFNPQQYEEPNTSRIDGRLEIDGRSDARSRIWDPLQSIVGSRSLSDQ